MLHPGLIAPVATGEKEMIGDRNRPLPAPPPEEERRGDIRLDRSGGDSGGQPSSMDMVAFPLIDQGADMWGKQKQLPIHNGAVNECIGEFWTRLANKACDSGVFEAARAMGEGTGNRFTIEKEGGFWRILI